VRGPAVCAGDHVDDREAQPRALARAGRVAAREGLERALEETRRKAVSLVLDVQLDAPVRRASLEEDPAPAVAQGVLDQVPEGLFDSQPVGVEGEPVVDANLEGAVCLRGSASVSLAHAPENFGCHELLTPDR
jgi:hypothetical protein